MFGDGPLGGKKKDDGGDEDWLTTYADAITLLMAFFVMLVNFSKIDIPRFEQVQAGIAQEIGKRDTVRPIQVLEVDLTDAVFNMGLDSAVSVSTDDEGIIMEMASGSFFASGTADLKRDAIPFLKEVGDLLNEPRYLGFQIEIEGHTDDDPIKTERFPSNWELGAGRAITLVRFFNALQVEAQRMRAISFGDTQPKLPNRDEDGNPIPENMEENRRVVVRIYPKYSRPVASR